MSIVLKLLRLSETKLTSEEDIQDTKPFRKTWASVPRELEPLAATSP